MLMKKSLLLFSMIAALCVTGCGVSHSSKGDEASNSDSADSTNINSDNSNNIATKDCIPSGKTTAYK